MNNNEPEIRREAENSEKPKAGQRSAGSQSPQSAPERGSLRRGRGREPELNAAGKTALKRRRKKKPYRPGFVPSLIKTLVYLIVVIVVSAFAAYYAICAANDLFAFVKSDAELSVTVPDNATVEDVADILSDCGAIKYRKLFLLYADLKKDDGKFIGGDYIISASMNYEQLLGAFKYQFVRSICRITIPEGYSCDDIIALFMSYGIGTKEGFADAINNTDFSEFPFVKALDDNPDPDRHYRLEGYLYPDTYDFYSDATPAQVIYKLLSNFNRKFKEVYYERAEAIGMTVDEVITLASYIQEETYYLDEYEFVSSVFHNRLNNPSAFPNLESDATVAYAIQIATGVRPDGVAATDLTFVSEYNTYQREGLTPGAISNPGYDAIVTAMYPATTSYYYFYTNKDNRITFSSTYAEHRAAILADQNTPE